MGRRPRIEVLRIDRLANGGAGLGRIDGQVIFVPKTAPGDLVRCRLVREKSRYAEGELLEVLEPGLSRQAPPCPVAEACGGCQWQHLPYPEQLRWKEDLFRDSLIRACNIEPQLVKPILPAPAQWHYRSRVQIKCFASKQGFVTGFFKPRSHFVVSMSTCPVLAEPLNHLLKPLRELFSASPYAAKIPQLDLALGDDGCRRVVVHHIGPPAPELAECLKGFAREHRLQLCLQSGRNETLAALEGDGELCITLPESRVHLKYAAGGFAQINLEQNRALVSTVLGAADLQGDERILDLFCGMGNFSLPLARRARSVVGVENYAPSIAMAEKNARANSLNNAEFFVRPAEGSYSELSAENPFDLLILDPPRSGAYPVMKELLARPVRKLIYVSCDPQTLARDLKALIHGGYRLLQSQPLDMFPQTFHCESFSVLEYSG